MKNEISDCLKEAWKIIKEENNFSSDIRIKFIVMETKDQRFGDLSSNVAMQLAKQVNRQPMDLAELFIKKLEELARSGPVPFSSTQAHAPGFINFFLKSDSFYDVLSEIMKKKSEYGFQKKGSRNKKVLIEYVSANPTGPLTLAHARQAVVGDVISNLLEADGYHVHREYYLNDRGLQIETLGKSIYLRYLEICGEKIEFPEDAYQGEYIIQIAQEIYEKDQKKWVEENEKTNEYFSEYGKSLIMKWIKKSLDQARVCFDEYFSEEKFVQTSAISEVLDIFKENNLSYQKDNATWFKSTQFDDDKDRVLIRSNGKMTYITPDIAYHKNKFKRGYDLLINIWGPDHHGYIPRMMAAMMALGYKKEQLKVIILQLSTLYEGDKKLSMSTRKGEFITQDEVIKEVGVDAARFFFCMRTTDAHLDFDLNLAKEKSPDNPVYYVQYAHARICNILRVAGDKGYDIDLTTQNVSLSMLTENQEKEIIKHLGRFSDVIHKSATQNQPCKLTEYLKDLARLFHSYYNKTRVVGEDKELSLTRLYFIKCIRQVIAGGLGLLKIDAPEKM